jgi:outer membrane receptor protein involved in Fe transport
MIRASGRAPRNQGRTDGRRAAALSFALIALVVPRTVVAAGERGIPVGDLPPFPDLSSDTEKVAGVSVYGAASTESDVVVGAAKREQSLGTVASAVTVVTADQLRRFGYRSLAEALRGVAGIYIVDDRMVERVGIRGVQILGDANTHILVLIDGSPLNEPWSQFVDGSTALPVNLDDVSRIEVIRGPVSSIYGTNAFFGIINIVSLEADKAPRAYGRASFSGYGYDDGALRGTYGANAAFGVGNVNRQVRGTVTYAGRNGESIGYPDFSGANFTGQTDADAMRSVAASLAVNLDQLFFQVRAYDRSRELPGAPYDGIIGSDANQNRDQQFLAEVGYTHDIGERVTVAGRAYIDRYRFTGRRSYPETGIFETTGDALWYGGEVRGLVDVLPQDDLLSLTAGVSVEQTRTSSASDFVDPAADTVPSIEVDRDFTIAGIYAEVTSEPLPWLGITAGLRSDNNSLFTSELSPRAALFLRKGEEYGLKFLYAQGFRNPSIFEAFYRDGQYFSPALDADGDSELRPENIASYEIVVYGRPLPGVKVRLSAWEWRMEDILRKDEYFEGSLNRRQIYFFNTASLVSRGAEVEAAYRDVAGNLGYANGALAVTGANCLGDDTLVGNPLLDTDVELGNCDEAENAPTLVLQTGVSSRLIKNVLHASTELAFVSSRGTQASAETVDAHLGWNVSVYFPNLHGFDLTLGARNLLGREDVPAQSDYNRTVVGRQGVLPVLTVPGPGRELFMRAGYRF